MTPERGDRRSHTRVGDGEERVNGVNRVNRTH
jgi:hypothetical protein